MDERYSYFGIDLGLKAMGCAHVSAPSRGGPWRLHSWAVVKSGPADLVGLSRQDRCCEAANRVAAWILEVIREEGAAGQRADERVVAIETPYLAKNAGTYGAQSELKGALWATVKRLCSGVRIVEVNPKQAKLAATGAADADKDAVRRMVLSTVRGAREKVTGTEQTIETVCDAVAVALGAARSDRLERFSVEAGVGLSEYPARRGVAE
jgi:Holliday junction resolvasome RuvABC endonuclease subunit